MQGLLAKKYSITALAIMFLAIGTEACANSVIGFGLYGVAPGSTLGPIYWLLLVAITFIEAIVIWRMLGYPYLTSLWYSLVLNIASTIGGFIYGSFVFTPMAVFIFWPFFGVLIWWFIARKNIPVWASIMMFCTFVAGLMAPGIYDASFSFPFPKINFAVTAVMPLLMGFSLSVFIEGVGFRWFDKNVKPWKAITVANIVSYVILGIFAVVFAYQTGFNPYTFGGAWQSRAKGTLRSIGSSQLAYRGTNDAKNYGSFKALQDELYIAEGYSLENMIKNYTMTWDVYNDSTVMDEYSELLGVHTFTVIAFPRDRRPGYLLTFAVTEDQVVRVYNPEGGNDPGNVKSWDPIL